MSIEKSIQKLIKAIQQPTRYMGDEPSIKVVPKPGNDPCAPLFEPLAPGADFAKRKIVPAFTICDFLASKNGDNCIQLAYQNTSPCNDAASVFARTSLVSATVLTAGSVTSICDNYAQSQLAAVSGQISQVQKNAILKRAKCACYKYALEGEPSIKPAPSNGAGLETIFPDHLRVQVTGAFQGKCEINKLKALCLTRKSIQTLYNNDCST